MAERRVIVCDHPGCGRDDAEHYEIRQDDSRRWIVDLCEMHAKPMIELGEMGRAHSLPSEEVTDTRVLQHFKPLVVLDDES